MWEWYVSVAALTFIYLSDLSPSYMHNIISVLVFNIDLPLHTLYMMIITIQTCICAWQRCSNRTPINHHHATVSSPVSFSSFNISFVHDLKFDFVRLESYIVLDVSISWCFLNFSLDVNWYVKFELYHFRMSRFP